MIGLRMKAAAAALLTTSGVLLLGAACGQAESRLRHLAPGNGQQAAPALAAHPGVTTTPASQLQSDEERIAAATREVAWYHDQPPPTTVLKRLAMTVGASNADYHYRQAVRRQQADIVDIARAAASPDSPIARTAPQLPAPVVDTVKAVQATWRLAGVDPKSGAAPNSRPMEGALPPGQLAAMYQAAGAHYGVDWTVLAAMNFVESDFGRVTGPSSAGAKGPMQFLPSTWQSYGLGGDINSPVDSVEAAARYLALHGARRDLAKALYAYHHDDNYVGAVLAYADAIRTDPAWVWRLYLWNTRG